MVSDLRYPPSITDLNLTPAMLFLMLIGIYLLLGMFLKPPHSCPDRATCIAIGNRGWLESDLVWCDSYLDDGNCVCHPAGGLESLCRQGIDPWLRARRDLRGTGSVLDRQPALCGNTLLRPIAGHLSAGHDDQVTLARIAGSDARGLTVTLSCATEKTFSCDPFSQRDDRREDSGSRRARCSQAGSFRGEVA